MANKRLLHLFYTNVRGGGESLLESFLINHEINVSNKVFIFGSPESEFVLKLRSSGATVFIFRWRRLNFARNFYFYFESFMSCIVLASIAEENLDLAAT
jgi:hypothetical protein